MISDQPASNGRYGVLGARLFVTTFCLVAGLCEGAAAAAALPELCGLTALTWGQATCMPLVGVREACWLVVAFLTLCMTATVAATFNVLAYMCCA